MQELRLVLIIVGGLAIVGLLIHGFWTSKNDNKSKFSQRPQDTTEPELSSESQPSTEKKRVSPPIFSQQSLDIEDEEESDPLLDTPHRSQTAFTAMPDDIDVDDPPLHHQEVQPTTHTLASESPQPHIPEPQTHQPAEPMVSSFEKTPQASYADAAYSSSETATHTASSQTMVEEIEPEVIVFHVHAPTDSEFVGIELFDSMKQNGLVFGERNIYHRYTDLVGAGKILFSVANMMKPGTLDSHHPDAFTTKGISFFMTLPCVGDADQNFKLMLRTAQLIADDLGANVLDDKRNLMTPNRISAYRQQIRDFIARSNEQVIN